VQFAEVWHADSRYTQTTQSAIPTDTTVTKDVNIGFAVQVLYDLNQ